MPNDSLKQRRRAALPDAIRGRAVSDQVRIQVRADKNPTIEISICADNSGTRQVSFALTPIIKDRYLTC